MGSDFCCSRIKLFSKKSCHDFITIREIGTFVFCHDSVSYAGGLYFALLKTTVDSAAV